ncbi:hypothetical protein J2Y45_006720 [Dyadobacter sp. BE34]|uniref:Uncharacterized protein n=1 Tax=Dyadobacter fermentans TaxID=94254 RepID=A0ABU1R8W5_9BACT|nr:hypothetical protein [Dyadobacter fermentans]MDR7047320.1 hypothetical protein [Dyadobacter sp. BE242]MDR7201556.1 hypothetical protein [Dyadobacter sp. BE34]MDR7219426.1 hypothetical protein [Dyadobacter sp. BE31]MDR7267180.1 hypothetical protein [Dyadobacter sp. BE32]
MPDNKQEIALLRVRYLPKVLLPGILYVSHDFNVAGHICPCGCGSKVITPLGISEWSLGEADGSATLYPSIGNWQLPCRSHYWIRNGSIEWSYQFDDEQIKAVYEREEKERIDRFENVEDSAKKMSRWRRFWKWISRYMPW